MRTILLTIALLLLVVGCDGKKTDANSAVIKKNTGNFLIGLCTVSTPEWMKYSCDQNLVMNSDVMAVSFVTFEETSMVVDLVFGLKCTEFLSASKCINKTYSAGSTYEFLSDGAIIQNTHASGCIVPSKYTMENDILYEDYGGDARGNCKEEQIIVTNRQKEKGKVRIYYVRK